MEEETVTLYRPVGSAELTLLRESGFKRWPPRLPEQPIFSPVTNEKYADEIASKWNARDSGVGFVTRFAVRKSFMDQFTIERVGASHHTEWWIPAERLEEMNDAIVGAIEVVGEFRKSADAPPDSVRPEDDSRPRMTMVVRLRNSSVTAKTIVLEPWAEERTLAPGAEVSISIESPTDDVLEVEISGDRTIVHAVEGSIVEFEDD